MKKIITLLTGIILLFALVLPVHSETQWQQVVSHDTQFEFNGNAITITHSTTPDGLDYIQQDFASVQDVTFEFDVKLGAVNHDSESLVLESNGGNTEDGLWLYFNPNGLYDMNSSNQVTPVALNTWYHFQIVSTPRKLSIYANGELKYERNGTFQPRSFLRFRDYGHCSGTVVNSLNNVRVSVNGTIGAHGTQFVPENELLKIIHSTTPNGFDYYQKSIQPMQNVVIDFDAKIGSTNNDNYSMLIDADGEGADNGLRLAFYQNQLRYYYSGQWHNVATVAYDKWVHYRVISLENKVAIYVGGDLRYTQSGLFLPRSFVRFKDYGLCGDTVVNYIGNFAARAVSSNDLNVVYDNFDYLSLADWTQNVTYGTQFSQSGNTLRIIHSTTPNGFDNISRTFALLDNAVIEFDAKLGEENNDNFSLLLESDGGYNVPDGLGLAFKGNMVMVYAGNDWKNIFTVPFNEWRHYKIVSTGRFLAIYVNDDLKYKRNGYFQPRSFIKFSDFGLCSNTVTNYLTNVRVRPGTENDYFRFYDDFNNQEVVGWEQNSINGTEFSQSGNEIRIIHSTTANGFDSITKDFTPLEEAVFEFDVKLGSEHNDNFSLLMESDGGYMASDGLGLAFQANVVKTYFNNNWQTIFTVPFDTWQHYRIVSTASWIAIYVNDDLKYKRNGTFRIRSFVSFSDFGLCSGTVINYVANVRTRQVVENDRFVLYDDFNSQALTGWTQYATHGTGFSQNNNGIRIIHTTVPGGFDYIQKSFDTLPEAVFEFDAKLGPDNNDNFSLLMESDGGYMAADGLGFAFKANMMMAYVNNDWQTICTVPLNEWRHYRIVSTPGWIAVFVNDDLKYKVNGTFRSRSFIKFSDFGLCTGTVVNYLANVKTRAAASPDRFTICDDFNNGTLTGWTVNTPDGSQFIAEDGVIKLVQVPGNPFIPLNDYLQRNFEPMQNMVLEFDAKMSYGNINYHTLRLEAESDRENGFYLAFYQNYLSVLKNDAYLGSKMFNYDEWAHYRVVYSATKIEVYVNGEWVYTETGNFGPRSFIRFSNPYAYNITNYLDNICIRPYIPEASSTDTPNWTSGWTTFAPDGSQIIQTDNLVTFTHAVGTQSDYLKRQFKPLQNVSVEFEAKIGAEGNTDYSLIIESDGGNAENGGLYLGFYQNYFQGYFYNGMQNIAAINYGEWNHFRIVSTLKKIQVYVNGVLRYTYEGTFNPRSFLRFKNAGNCAVTNYIRNIMINPVTPNAIFTNVPDWNQDWVIHNPDGSQFVRENDAIKLVQVPGTPFYPLNDYLQRNFAPMQNMLLEFDAKITNGNINYHTLRLEAEHDRENGFYLAFYQNALNVLKNDVYLGVKTINYGEWVHYRVVYSATKIEVYVNGEWVYTETGNFGPRSFIRFSNPYPYNITNYLDNICIRPFIPEVSSTDTPIWTSNWTKHTPDGTQFIPTGNTYTIKHAMGTQSDYLQREFKPLQNVSFEFDAKIGSEGNNDYSLIIESNGGNTDSGGLYLGFYQNYFQGFFYNGMQNISTINYGGWNHYRIVSTLKKIQVYVNGVLRYTYEGTFNPRSFLRFKNAGGCVVTNYVRNIMINPVIPDATFANETDWTQDWVLHNPGGSQFIRENDAIKLVQLPGSPFIPLNDYLQRNFEPMQNMVLEFDAKITNGNINYHTLRLEAETDRENGFYLAFYQNFLCVLKNDVYLGAKAINYGEWAHFRVVYSATKIEVYINGEWVYTETGNFGPRSFIRFSNPYPYNITNYLDNICIRPFIPEVSSTETPIWTSGWTTNTPDGTQFIPSGTMYTVKHVVGTQRDYLQRKFNALQNVSFEFEAKIGSGNTDYSLMIESDGGNTDNGGLYFGFYQNYFQGFFYNGMQNISTINYGEWNHFRIVSTLRKIQVYVNGVLRYTYEGTFNPRSFLRFTNAGSCAVTNYIRNININPVIPDATFTNVPDWSHDWVIHNPDGTQVIRENDAIKLVQVPKTPFIPLTDYLQCSFAPMQNMVLEFDAKITNGNINYHTLRLEAETDRENGFYLVFYQNSLCVLKNDYYLAYKMINYDEWAHYRVVYSATKIEVYANGEWVHTETGNFGLRSFVRFSNPYPYNINNYLDNISIRAYEAEPDQSIPAGLPPNCTAHNPGGTQFEMDGNAIKIEHALGSDQDYLQYDFNSMQDVVIEFNAKLGSVNNTNRSMIVESNGGQDSNGLSMAFNMNNFEIYTGSAYENKATVDFDKWNYYRIVCTATTIEFYVNNQWVYTATGSFAARSFLRFRNTGLCKPTNYIANIRVTPLANWDDEWYMNNLDTKPPIVSGVWPMDGQSLNYTTVTISGRITDASEVTVKVNGVSTPVMFGQFCYNLDMNQGTNQFTIEARDAAGNTTTVTRSIFIDSILPAEFTPVANPSSWSTNTQPVITFSTTDDGSGIDHYEVLLDNNVYDSAATSPYQFPAIFDGEHTVKVKAVDHTGNIRYGEVKVYVDTTAPGQPQAFRVVPGNGEITLRWVAPDPDVIEYRIARTPSWSEPFRSTDGTELVDSGLENGVQYQYTIWAIDHALNVGPAADPSEGTVGLAEAEYEPDKGAVVEYEDITLFVNPDSLPAAVESIKVTEIESQDMATQSMFPIVSPIYQFTAKVRLEDGTRVDAEHLEFKKEFQAMVTYDPAMLPPGCPEQNLGVYYFDPMWSRWFRVEKAGVDVSRNLILFSTNHFTSFSVQPTVIEDLSPQQLKDVEYSPFKTELSHDKVSISPEGGSVMTSMTELVLPGMNGFNFELKRSYDSATAVGDAYGISVNAAMYINISQALTEHQETALWISKSPLMFNSDFDIEGLVKKWFQNCGDYSYSMGLGWRVNLPYIRGANSSVLIRLPSGGFYSINQMKILENDNPYGVHRKLKLENHEGEDFTLYVEQERLDIDITQLASGQFRVPGWQVKKAQLILKDGTTYDMDELGRTTKITDPSGLNVINVSYTGLTLNTIEDSMGRRIRFGYDEHYLIPRINRIWVEDENYNVQREINYTLESALSCGQYVAPLLKKAVDVGGRESTYEYNSELLFSGGIGFKVNVLNCILDWITWGQWSEWTKATDITISGRVQFIWAFPINFVKAPGVGINHIYYERKSLQYNTVTLTDYVLGFIPVSISVSFDVMQRLYANKLEISKAYSNIVQTINYTYNVEYYGHEQFYTRSSVVDNGKTRVTYYYKAFVKSRNRWIDWSDALAEQINKALDAKSIVQGLFTENPYTYDVLTFNTTVVTCDSQSGLSLESNYNEYDDDTFRPLTQTTARGSNQHRKSYRYDKWGNVIYQDDYSTTGERTNQITILKYYWPNQPGADFALHALDSPFTQGNIPQTRRNLPVGMIVANYTPNINGGQTPIYQHTFYQYDGHGQQTATAKWNGSQWLVTRTDYDEAGKITKKTNPIGHETVYEYDLRSMPKSVTEKTVQDVQGNTVDLVLRTGYQWITGWKLWEQDARGFVTENQYDNLGRITKITSPDDDDQPGWTPLQGSSTTRANNPVQSISYQDDPLSNGQYTAVVIDQRGNMTKYLFNELGQLVRLYKYRRVNGYYIDAAMTYIQYDNWGNVISITDPNGKTTQYEYDALGYNTRIIYPADQGPQPMKQMDLDYNTNIITVTDENGHISYEYLDMLDRTYKKVQMYDGTSIISESYFDGLGNEVITVDPRGSVTTNIYNQLDQVVRVNKPTETFWENGSQVTVTPYQRFVYNDAGYKIAEIHTLPGSGNEITTQIQVDALGRTIRTIVPCTDQGTIKQTINEFYYDGNGNRVKVVDANNTSLPLNQQKAWIYEYSANNKKLAETNPAGNRTTYTYDLFGNLKTMTDPRGNSGNYTGDFTIIYEYDDLNRLVTGYLPAAPGQTVKPEIHLIYDARGNLLERHEPDGGKTIYTYTVRNMVATETKEGSGVSYTMYHHYDSVGNEIETIDARGKTTTKEYNELNLVKQINYPETDGEVIESFQYDGLGNKIEYINGLQVATTYKYDRYNHLSEVRDGNGGITSYHYDRQGNMTQVINALGHTTNYQYDELNRLLQETDPQGHIKQYRYDSVGNKKWSLDAKGTTGNYEYRPDNLLSTVTLQNGDISNEIYFLYDEAGFKKWARYGNVITDYNINSMGSYVPHPFNRIYNEKRNFDGQTFTVGYDYDVMGRLTQITYPTGQTVDYQYNNLGQLQGVPGFVNEVPVYDQGGMISSIKAVNGITTKYERDDNGRLTKLSHEAGLSNVLKAYNITYNGANNIIKKNDDVYRYDALNQLIFAGMKGNFETNPDESGPSVGRVRNDFKGQRACEFELNGIDLTELDYAAGSIGVDLGQPFQITRLELEPNSPVHRVANKDSIQLYHSLNNSTYTLVQNWKMTMKPNGMIQIMLDNPVTARYFKVKSLHDERNFEFEAVNQAQFINAPQDLIHVYYLMPTRTEEYTYNAIGNRTRETITQRSSVMRNYTYYPNSSRLQTNGKYTFEYDANGNLTKKETLVGPHVIWLYEYDLLNRLVKVRKDNQVVAEYMYNQGGFRIKKTSPETTIYYMSDSNGNTLYEQENRQYIEYVYVFGNHFARIDGNLDHLNETTKYFYHTDHLGSTVLVTDEQGQQVWNAEFTPFGKQVSKNGTLDHVNQFTGKDLDEDTGMFYYYARWMDPETGRFISEDPAQDKNNPNLYTFCRNNPITIIDPTGLWTYEVDKETGELYAIAEKDDTLSGLGWEMYGSASAATQIGEINGIKNIDQIQEGQRVRLEALKGYNNFKYNHFLKQAFIRGDISYQNLVDNGLSAVSFDMNEIKALQKVVSTLEEFHKKGKISDEKYYKELERLGGKGGVWEFSHGNCRAFDYTDSGVYAFYEQLNDLYALKLLGVEAKVKLSLPKMGYNFANGEVGNDYLGVRMEFELIFFELSGETQVIPDINLPDITIWGKKLTGNKIRGVSMMAALKSGFGITFEYGLNPKTGKVTGDTSGAMLFGFEYGFEQN